MRSHINQLTFPRFLAALWVVLFHHYQSIEHVLTLPFPVRVFLENGNLAVPFFFSLSGFILACSSSDRDLTNSAMLGKFFKARFARIYPVYALALLLAIVLEHIHDVYRIVLNLLCLQSWQTSSFDNVINYPSWSLSVEVFFYVTFPIWFTILRRFTTNQLVAFIIVVMVCSELLQTTTLLYKLPNALQLLSCFVTGIAFGLLYNQHKKLRINPPFELLLILIIAGVAYSFFSFSSHLFIYTCLLGWFLLQFSLTERQLARWFSHPALIILGEISYGIYIFQVPLENLFLRLLNRVHLKLEAGTYICAYLIFLISFSYLVNLFFEKPMRQLVLQKRVNSG